MEITGQSVEVIHPVIVCLRTAHRLSMIEALQRLKESLATFWERL